MPVIQFPKPEEATPEGLIAVGGDLHPETLIQAYSQGIFPWPIEGLPLTWFCPWERGILFFRDLHISRSLQKALSKGEFEITFDSDFHAVITHCANTPRKGEPGTWITPELVSAYTELHDLGLAHSVEVWKEGKLVGGLYGVAVQGVFSAESKFHLVPNASKIALVALVQKLRDAGLEWMDVQVLNPHIKTLGAKEIPQKEFLKLLKKAQKKGLEVF